MILGIDQFWIRLKAQYDKVIAFVVLLLLVSSLIYLGVKVGLIRQMQQDFDGWLKTRSPLHPHAARIESGVYDAAVKAMESPFVLDSSVKTNGSMFVPQTRFNCRDCRMPVNINGVKCPFCGADYDKPTETALNADDDNDGIPNAWEIKYGLDPFDPTDAEKDNDGDGYSSLAEYKAGTDPTDLKSHSAAVEQLVLESITGEKFGLRFKSRIKTGSGYKFVLNYRLPTGEVKTDFVSIGDTVAGVVVEKYEEKFIETRKNFPKKDVSELTLLTKTGDRIVLVIGKATRHVKLTAHLTLTLPDGKTVKFDVAKNDEFDVDDKMYKVIAIDGVKKNVVIRDKSNQKEIVIQRTSASI